MARKKEERVRTYVPGDLVEVNEHGGTKFLDPRDAATGKLRIPPEWMPIANALLYDPKIHTDLELTLVTNFAPEGQITGKYKLYEVAKFRAQGWPKKAEAVVELPLNREHERQWFQAFNGQRLMIYDRDDPKRHECWTRIVYSELVIVDCLVDGRRTKTLFEGRLRMRETLLSAIRRRKLQVLLWAIAAVGAALISALVGF